MERFRQTNQNTPLCKFGPGGDYVSEWDAVNAAPAEHKETHLGQVLNVIAEIIGATVQPEILTEIACALPVEEDSHTSLPEKSNNQEIQADGPKHTSYPKAARNASTSRKLSKQPMLFGDDWGTGTSTKHKPNHRLRAHRKPSRKRPVGPVHGQGTLFEVDTLGRKTA
jgi:hypothetical protein